MDGLAGSNTGCHHSHRCTSKAHFVHGLVFLLIYVLAFLSFYVCYLLNGSFSFFLLEERRLDGVDRIRGMNFLHDRHRATSIG